MTIQNLDGFVGGLWDWDILAGCFGGSRIMPTDIDGLVEHNGNFLLLEAKRPGVLLKTGQRIVFERLQRTGLFTVIVAWGDTNTPMKLRVMTPKVTRDFEPANLEMFRSFVAQWYVHAHCHPRLECQS